ncbi:FAD-dependent oxidoreductase [Nocardia sp. NPDC060220]|uniref:FAD-dependent oxidoreductase n=1 Tax=Nocardia sp. NPDC060220 TaxID=3347076 RepID=UPI003656E5DD
MGCRPSAQRRIHRGGTAIAGRALPRVRRGAGAAHARHPSAAGDLLGAARFRRAAPQRTPIEGLFLAGDWTETGMPSTMEAAVESAVRAVGAVHEYLVPRTGDSRIK